MSQSDSKTDFSMIAQWFHAMMETKTDHLCLDCIVMNPRKGDGKPTWESSQQTIFARVSSGQDFSHAEKEAKRLPAKAEDPQKPWVGRWLGVFEQVLQERGKGWDLHGPILDMTRLPKNLLEWTQVYVAYRQKWLENPPKPRYH